MSLSIVENHNKSVAQVILRRLVQHKIIVIPKTVHQESIRENYQIFDFTLALKELADIETLGTHQSVFFSHRDPAMVRSLSSRT